MQNADGTLLATPQDPDEAMVRNLLARSDVMCTGWHAAVSADVRPGSTVVVGDGVAVNPRPARTKINKSVNLRIQA